MDEGKTTPAEVMDAISCCRKVMTTWIWELMAAITKQDICKGINIKYFGIFALPTSKVVYF